MKNTYDASISRAVSELRTAQDLVISELGSYPTPVSGCDAQYNHLLSVRSQLSAALSSLTTPVFVATPRTLSSSSESSSTSSLSATR